MSGPGGRRLSEPTSYHGQPVLKAPVWGWEIPSYLFAGGLAGGSAGLAYLAGLRGNDTLSRRAWLTSSLSISASPPLLIADLGRPERFLYMLRMIKVTSPMSMGTWFLTFCGAGTSLSALHAYTGKLPRAAAFARPIAALSGLPLATYTGTLLANTAVPAWHEASRTLPFVFGAGAALSAGAAGTALTPRAHAGPARRLALGAAVAELAAAEVISVDWVSTPRPSTVDARGPSRGSAEGAPSAGRCCCTGEPTAAGRRRSPPARCCSRGRSPRGGACSKRGGAPPPTPAT